MLEISIESNSVAERMNASQVGARAPNSGLESSEGVAILSLLSPLSRVNDSDKNTKQKIQNS